MKKTETDLRLYILIRTDLDSLCPGKMGAQTSHASNAFVYQYPAAENPEVAEWQNQTNQGFGTCITLAATLADIDEIVRTQPKHAFFNTVIDPTYPYDVTEEIKDLLPTDIHTAQPVKLRSGLWRCFREEVTCMYYFGNEPEGDIFKRPIKHLNLYK